jgi:hypoxanthine phosphoribosyltransferase
MGKDLERVLITEEQIHAKLDELAGEIAAEYQGKDLLFVGVLKGAVMVMADLMRALPITAPVDWMAVSSYGSGTKSSGVVRILKDLDVDITGKHVLIVEDIVDSGLTLSWIKANLESASTSPTSSSSATAWTTPSSTAGSARSARSPRTSTAERERCGRDRRSHGGMPLTAPLSGR